MRSIDHAGRLDARFDARQLGLFILVQPKVNIWNQVRDDLISQPDSLDNFGVDDEVASFVLPIGATINMDGTSLYQAVAAVFIAQSFGMDLSLATQLGIIVTATLASIGSAAVPGAGMVMLVIVLAQAGIPEAGLALIFAIDRPLDMCRTTVNVTGDAAVSMIVAKSVNKLA